MIRAVIVDDSPTVRSLLRGILESDHQIEVVGTASDGDEAVALVQKLRPDVVTMDVQMPRMNGFDATKEIMITSPTRIVIVTASTNPHDVAGAMSTFKAGALALLVKPPGPDSPDFDAAAAEVLATVKAMAQVKVVRHHRPAVEQRTGMSTEPQAARIVAIAASTGGPQALQTILGDLPRDFPVPVLVVQHISMGFTAGLTNWLSTTTSVRVKLAEAKEQLMPSTVYIAPDDFHLGVTHDRRVLLSGTPAIGGFRPSGDFLFESVASVYGKWTAAVILTGMGEDGVAGLRAVSAAGGRAIAQDEATSIVFGMPAAAIREEVVERVCPVDRIAAQLMSLVGLEPIIINPNRGTRPVGRSAAAAPEVKHK